VLGRAEIPSASPFDKGQLVWRLMRLLPVLLAEDAFAPLRRFLARDTDARKLHQLALRIADLFDQYQVYRADWWPSGAPGHDYIDTSRKGRVLVPSEQALATALWRALLRDVGRAGAAPAARPCTRASSPPRRPVAPAAGPAAPGERVRRLSLPQQG
jgi:exodeoxyribonuclease V gamma subunit